LIKNCYFEKCSSDIRGGSVFFYNVGSPQLLRSKFIECSAGISGGGAYIREFKSPSGNKECVSGCYFTKCIATRNDGGGIEIFAPPSEFKMQNTIFISCNAKYNGGGFYFNGGTNDEVKRFLYCYFDKNTAGTGFDAYLILGSYNNEEGPFQFSFSSTSPKGNRTYFYGKGYKENWLPDGTLNRLIKFDGGEDKVECGVKVEENEIECKTINYSIGLIKEHGGWWINVLDNATENSSIIIEKDIFVKLIGKSEDVSLTNSDSSSLFSVSGILEIYSFTLSVKDPSLFSISSTAEVELESLTIKSLNNNVLKWFTF